MDINLIKKIKNIANTEDANSSHECNTYAF
jgi:hypothetical protein